MQKDADVIVIGAGIAGLTTAALLANQGQKVLILEKNWLPGGCASAYPRKHYVFESGATTLVGLDENMPLRYLLDQIGIEIPVVELDLPMQVHLKNGTTINRYKEIEAWIAEAERVFGKKNQRVFWEKCYEISQAVWEISLQQRQFPPSSLSDLVNMALNFRPKQLRFARYAFQSLAAFMKKLGLDENPDFVDFVNEQLLITAQNHASEVNMLFGATALCYTNYGNFYINGGLINLVNPLVNFIQQKGGEVLLRTGVEKVKCQEDGYIVTTQDTSFRCKTLFFGIPINNVTEIFEDKESNKSLKKSLLPSEKLNGAFTMGAVYKRTKSFESIHHQLHLNTPLPYTGSHSIFVSMSQEKDTLRCKSDEIVLNISTHVPNPEKCFIADKSIVEAAIFETLAEKLGFSQQDLIFYHSSTPKSWQKWTSRKWGFVGGYPQYMGIKPWQMQDARLDHKNAYLCGDSTYPGQGIPGAALSGIIAFEKWMSDKR